MKNQDENLNKIRHSAAHLLAAAVMDLYPNAKRTIGPAIENGYYYDFDFGDEKVSDEDVVKIESKMKEILSSWNSFECEEVTVVEAKKRFADNPYKLELINEFSQEGKTLTIYKSGNFEDLCRGGHVENPAKEIGAFKLLSVAGAYWRGDEKNKMLTRIYATAFPSQKELDAYLKQQEEISKRDHKKLGPQLDLFTFSNLVGSGLPLWTPKGTMLRDLLNDYVWELRKKYGYQKVTIPHITKKDLYEKSGHWAKFSEELFKIETREGHLFAMKPMNCPHHTQIFASRLRSYREMPQRYAETTMCYRDEQSGELSGLSRVRGLTQDDAHVFCAFSQAEQEISNVFDIVKTFYGTFGFELKPRLSTHDPEHMEKYLGDESRWQEAEAILANFLKSKGVEYLDGVGEAAFYGPKIDFMSKDALGRTWQVATIQLDLNMAGRFELYFINEKGEQETPVMIHAAIMGSIERFLSILIEHYGGSFPTWLSPVQIVIIPIADRHLDYAREVENQLLGQGVRVEVDERAESMQSKIRDAQMQKIPYMLVVGDKEMESNKVAVRKRSGENLGAMDFDQFKTELLKEINDRK
ncbi:MAG: threonine--tRNA ligase [Patescibacteria group bacterium]|nr:MAG: threonine--tRNA ligase [Patescibacteria group bacterium]